MAILSTTSYSDSPNLVHRVEISTGARNVDSIYVSFQIYTRLRYSESWLGSGSSITVSIYAAGSWHSATMKSSSSTWSGTGEHYVAIGVTIPLSPSQTTISGIYFSTSGYCALGNTGCSNISIGASTTYLQADASTLAVSTIANNAVSVRLAGLETASGYTRNIQWYRDGTLQGTTSSNTTAALTYNFTGLVPAKTYKLSAKICSGTTAVRTLDLSATTSNETMSLAATTGATTATLTVSGMQSSPSYTRQIKVYVKQGNDYVLYGTYKTQSDSTFITVENLEMLTEYNFKITVGDGTSIYVSDVIIASTVIDYSMLPTPFIRSLKQEHVGGPTVVDWGTDRLIQGTLYTIGWEGHDSDGAIIQNDVSNVTLNILEDGGQDVTITSRHAAVEHTKQVTSRIYLATKFNWSDDARLKASDWTSLRRKINYRLLNAGENNYPASEVVINGITKASDFNLILNGLKQCGSSIALFPKKPGDRIVISEIEALATAFNNL